MKREIFYCNLIVEVEKGKKIEKKKLENVVHLDGDKEYKGQKVLSVEVLKSLGFSNETTSFVEVKKSDEKRNNITGAYE